MAAIFERYTQEMRKEFGYLSAWLPTTRIDVGDVGYLDRARFDRHTSLPELGIDAATQPGRTLADLDYASRGSVAVTLEESARGLPGGQDAEVTFSREHGVLFQARKCRTTRIADLQALGRAVLALHREGKWDAAAVVVTEVVHSGPTVILVSNQRGARIGLRAHAAAPLAGALALADAATGLRVVSTQGIGVKIIEPRGLTPLFRVCGIRRRLLGDPDFEHRGEPAATAEHTGEQWYFSTLTYEDLGA
ncbi:hypothetical protein [Streptomyces sp. CBMA123]|uniref:hypothetical protein n=1 Tax=Streptomyces sp. CBMA123 TaxID=1896313 RepID=UPI001661E17D|nr:hypothetical protein [Streptomyces sp. CBMA123]